MSSIIMKKKKFKFSVELELVELSSVPLVNAVLFGKIRLLDGGSLSQLSSREAVQDHMVHWGQKFKFNCRMSASASTGVLEPCLCRVSIRKELKGGKSYMKCGFVNVNLAEYAGSGSMTRRYLLEGYDSSNRQDNSILKVSVEMTLLSGDPLFKAPDVKSLSLPGEGTSDPLGLATLRADEGNRGGSAVLSNVGAGSSGRSGGQKNRTNLLTSALVSTPDSDAPLDESFEQSHSRTSSYNSQQSKGSAYSLTNSNTSSNPEHSSSATSLTDQASDKDGPSRDSWRGTAERRRKHAEEQQKARRVDDTRVDADEVIEGLISGQDFSDTSQGASDQGLQLYIAKDGSTALGSNHLKSRMSAGTFQQVVIDKR
ncbi:hypothetical protein HOLleu_17282 [Holothuria leucospilota]|uniref:C2 NT-type domain-containing protein n=1 Tax=Holothuria leucospilota TaxID=206669 RepID=A0A9Q1C702_HOLLE|nr:hypothetical protein HOLleu_17282 [Holothuria leucospilota]